MERSLIRERVLKYGADSLFNNEAISFLLGISNEELNKFNSLHELEENIDVLGITKLQKEKLNGFFTLARRFQDEKLGERIKISSPNDAAFVVMEEMRWLKKEYFKIIILDTKNNVMSVEQISEGSLNSSIVHPRETFKPAIQKSASSVILVHNHPSGESEPSHEDIVLTNRLDECGKILGIKVLDHIIIGNGVFYSFKEEGLI
ncbi:hypothetical protein SDC9_48155 [bioreactor metagenome]|uniref:MPN domain-containing protein n=1 Tax=bioreactor metagenome TaxID=1076179 RepID=A0A644WDJ5_9ZZZZ